jgi:tRNA pseudouridine-54 N-methylase
MSDEELLIEIEKALKAVVAGGQEYTVPGLAMKRPTFEQLLKYRDEIRTRIDRTKSGGIGYQVGVAGW